MIKHIEALEGFITSQVSVLKSLVTLAKLEASLARISIYPFMLTLCAIIAVTLTAWITTMAFLGYLIAWKFKSVLIGMCVIWCINLMMLCLLLKYAKFNLRNMSFIKTRTHLNENKTYEQS